MVRRSLVLAAVTLTAATTSALVAQSAEAATASWVLTSAGNLIDNPSAVAAGPAGRMWYATQRQLSVGTAYGLAWTNLSGRTRFYRTPAANSVAALPGGVVYATEDITSDTHSLIRLSPSGHVSTLPLPTAGAEGSSMIAGPDGDGWFVETSQDSSVNAIGRVTPGGQISEFPLPDATIPESDGITIMVPATPVQVVAGPSQTVWVAVSDGVDVLNAQGQVIRTLSYPDAYGYPEGLAVGGDGTAWVATGQTYAVAISPDGVVSTPAMPAGMTADNAGVGPGGVVYLMSEGGLYSGLWQADGPGGPRGIPFTVNVRGLGSHASIASNGLEAIAPGPARTLWISASLMSIGSTNGLVTVDLAGRCIVPKLYLSRSFSYTIGQARALLRQHRCALGHVDYESHIGPEVICQRLAAGSVRRHGTRVAVGVATLNDVIPRRDFTHC